MLLDLTGWLLGGFLSLLSKNTLGVSGRLLDAHVEDEPSVHLALLDLLYGLVYLIKVPLFPQEAFALIPMLYSCR